MEKTTKNNTTVPISGVSPEQEYQLSINNGEIDHAPVTVERGDVFFHDQKVWRVIENNEDFTFLIALDGNEIVRYDPILFFRLANGGEYKKIKDPDPVFSIDPNKNKKELARIRDMSYAFENILRNQYPEWCNLLSTRIQKPFFHEWAQKLGMSKKTLTRRFLTYLQSGRNEYSLIDRRHFQQNTRPIFALSKIDDGTNRSKGKRYKDGYALQALQFAFENFKTYSNVYKAWYAMAIEYYSDETVVDGKTTKLIRPDSEIITERQVRYYISQQLGMSVKSYLNGTQKERNKNRPMSGNSRYGLNGLGELYQIDACELPVYIVDPFEPNKVAGKAIAYGMIDVFADIVVSVSVGYDNNKVDGSAKCIINAIEPHINQTERYGVTVDEYVFPSLVRPGAICSDHGADFESRNYQSGCEELGIDTDLVPPGQPSWKGLIENFWFRLQKMMGDNMIKCGFIEEEVQGPRKARKYAVLTMDDVRAIVYECVKEINQRVLPSYVLDLEQSIAKISPTPSEIYAFEKKRSGNPQNITKQNAKEVLFAFLQRPEYTKRKFTIDASGINYVGHFLKFFTEEKWFIDMILTPSLRKECVIRYDDEDLSCVYVRYKNEIRKVPLALKREELGSYKGLTWYQYDLICKANKDRAKMAERISLARRYETDKLIQQICNVAALYHGDLKNDTQNIKEAKVINAPVVAQEGKDTKARIMQDTAPAIDENEIIDVTAEEVKPVEDVDVKALPTEDTQHKRFRPGERYNIENIFSNIQDADEL